MESSFRTGGQVSDSNYAVNLVETHLAPIASGLLFVFSLSFVYVCKRQSKEVHEFARFFALLSALTMVMLAYSYSIGDTTTLLRTRINAVLAYKDLTVQSIRNVRGLLQNVADNPFSACSDANLDICKNKRFFLNTSNYIRNKLEPDLSYVLNIFENVLDASSQATLQSNLDTFEYYSSSVQWILYGLFIGIGTLIWISILGKIKGRLILHGVGGLLSFACLILSLGMLIGSHTLADLCNDPTKTLSELIVDPDVSFYFNCTPNVKNKEDFTPKGPFPPDFNPILPLLKAEPFVDVAYLGVCLIDPIILGPLNASMRSILNSTRENCVCPCNYTLINSVRTAIASKFDNSGLFNTFECSNFQSYIAGLTGGLCGYFSPFVNYFFLLLSLSGHALFLFYFVPIKSQSVAYFSDARN